jgi:hypothetical protein
MLNFSTVLISATACVSCFLAHPVLAASFCDELNAVFASSGTFSDIAGPAKSKDHWQAKLQISGFPECEISRSDDKSLFYHCYGKHFTAKADARRAYDDLKKRIDSCLPVAEWRRTEMTGQMISYGFFNSGKGLSGGLSIYQNFDIEKKDGDSLMVNVWFPVIAVYQRKQ